MPRSPSEPGKKNANGAVGRHEGFAAGAAREPPLETGCGGGRLPGGVGLRHPRLPAPCWGAVRKGLGGVGICGTPAWLWVSAAAGDAKRQPGWAESLCAL